MKATSSSTSSPGDPLIWDFLECQTGKQTGAEKQKVPIFDPFCDGYRNPLKYRRAPQNGMRFGLRSFASFLILLEILFESAEVLPTMFNIHGSRT